jgi:hypothetical protein
MEMCWESYQWQVFEAMQNVTILHQYRMPCDFEQLMNKKVEDWVKAQSMAWYLHFLMTQYENQRWVKHF